MRFDQHPPVGNGDVANSVLLHYPPYLRQVIRLLTLSANVFDHVIADYHVHACIWIWQVSTIDQPESVAFGILAIVDDIHRFHLVAPRSARGKVVTDATGSGPDFKKARHLSAIGEVQQALYLASLQPAGPKVEGCMWLPVWRCVCHCRPSEADVSALLE